MSIEDYQKGRRAVNEQTAAEKEEKERAGMTNILLIIAILLLVDIYGKLKKLNERQGKEDAGNND